MLCYVIYTCRGFRQMQSDSRYRPNSEDVVSQKRKRPPKKEQSSSASGVRTVDFAPVVSKASPLQGLDLPKPFGRVEGGVYSVNEDLTRALGFARSLPGETNAQRGRAADKAGDNDTPWYSVEPARRCYAEELRFTARVSSPAVIKAFATVPRERFVGPGPWRIRSPMNMDEYWSTADADPRHVYHDVLIALDEMRGINNGQPSLWARIFDHLDIQRGEKVLHLGCGTGYYTAIAAELVGRAGWVKAVEIDATLAQVARIALASWRQVTFIHADGANCPFEPADVVIASAGATHLPPSWLNALKLGGRLVFPMTTAESLAAAELSTDKIALSAGGGPGAMLLVVRKTEDEFTARFLCRAGFIHFQGARDQDADRRLAAALVRDWGSSVRSLRRDCHAEDETCWLHGAGWCLSRRTNAGALSHAKPA
jgi:protein-L-isoaspartate(D-aspartate) O-methyltransferase